MQRPILHHFLANILAMLMLVSPLESSLRIHFCNGHFQTLSILHAPDPCCLIQNQANCRHTTNYCKEKCKKDYLSDKKECCKDYAFSNAFVCENSIPTFSKKKALAPPFFSSVINFLNSKNASPSSQSHSTRYRLNLPPPLKKARSILYQVFLF